MLLRRLGAFCTYGHSVLTLAFNSLLSSVLAGPM